MKHVITVVIINICLLPLLLLLVVVVVVELRQRALQDERKHIVNVQQKIQHVNHTTYNTPIQQDDTYTTHTNRQHTYNINATHRYIKTSKFGIMMISPYS